jgi:hypothetical protein
MKLKWLRYVQFIFIEINHRELEIFFSLVLQDIISKSSETGKQEKISPKIASIQQRFLNGSNGTDFKGLQDTLTRSKKSPPEGDLPPPPPPPRSTAPKKYEFGQPQQVQQQNRVENQQQPPARPSKLTLDNVVQVKSALSKMSLTSSSDSLSSNASVNTVKSVSPNKELSPKMSPSLPPSLPPRQSPSKSPASNRPPIASPDNAEIKSPLSVPNSAKMSPVPAIPNGAKPTVPSRASKPQMSPLRALPSVPTSGSGFNTISGSGTSGKAPAAPPSPPPLVSKSYPGSPVKKVCTFSF